jgi:hypothetical protein
LGKQISDGAAYARHSEHAERAAGATKTAACSGREPHQCSWSAKPRLPGSRAAALVSLGGSVVQLEKHAMHWEDPGYYVGWFTLAMINAGLAQGKNRSGLAWFVVSLLLGPFATFVIVALLDRVGP